MDGITIILAVGIIGGLIGAARMMWATKDTTFINSNKDLDVTEISDKDDNVTQLRTNLVNANAAEAEARIAAVKNATTKNDGDSTEEQY